MRLWRDWLLLLALALLAFGALAVLASRVEAQTVDDRISVSVWLKSPGDTATMLPTVKGWGGMVFGSQPQRDIWWLGIKLDPLKLDSLKARSEVVPDTFRTAGVIDSIRPKVRTSQFVKPAGGPSLFEHDWVIEAAGAPAAWALGATGKGVILAVEDAGAGPHSDLGEFTCFNAVTSTNTGCQDDVPACNGHGTHTATTAHYLAPKADLLIVKVAETGASDCWLDDAAIYGGILHMAYNVTGPRVMSVSLGGIEGSWFCTAVDELIAHGGTFLASAGNTGGPAHFPGACTGGVMVTSVDAGMNKAPSSAWQIQPGWNPLVVASGGVGIVAGMPGGGWASKNGTSMATPNAAGIAALLGGKLDFLCAGANPTTPQEQTGCGFLRADKAVAASRGGVAFTGDTIRTYTGVQVDSAFVVCLGVCQVTVEGAVDRLPDQGQYVRWIAKPSLGSSGVVRIRDGE